MCEFAFAVAGEHGRRVGRVIERGYRIAFHAGSLSVNNRDSIATRILLHRRRRLIVMLKQTLICLLFSSMANADSELLEVRLQAILDEAVEAGLPAVSASLVRGEQSWAGVAGETSSSSGEPLNVNSRFRIASITKLFTATVILQLVDEGKLHLSDTLTELLPEGPGSDIPDAGSISLSMLLDHTSGIRNFTDDSAFWQEAYERRGLDRTWEPAELIDLQLAEKTLLQAG